jgi:truncated hemoglobin YjbI
MRIDLVDAVYARVRAIPDLGPVFDTAIGEPRIRAAVDRVMASNEAWVSPGQEVAFLSAFSGG